MKSRDETQDKGAAHTGVGTRQRLDFLVYSDRFRIDRYLSGGNSMSLLLFEIEHFDIFNDLYGGLIAGRVMEIMDAEIRALCKEHLSDCDLQFVHNLEPGKFLILFGKKGFGVESLSEIVLAFRLNLRSRIRQEALNLTGRNLHIMAGHSLLEASRHEGVEQLLYKSLMDAQKVARGTLDASKLSLLQEFRDLIASRNLNMVYQPIVNLETGEILAWEALTRGPKDSHFLAPAVLFDFAEEVGQVFILEKTARERAIERLGTLENDQKLFLTCIPAR